ncbi:MAG: NADH-quinone oxidoreductase subunit E [Rhodospirillales bacterium 20-60-12]|nr:MAG: NADH-quinone oxidoreductase subunit E [Rhodospirillales bacterium 20-60-12]
MSIAEEKMHLTPADIAALGEIVGHYPHKRAACIDALKYMQARHGYVSDQSLEAIAVLLDMSPAELDEVATFYNLIFRKPVGEKVIYLCDSVTCWMLGRDKIARKIQDLIGIRQGETSTDGRYTLLPIVCLGHCDHAPAMMIDDRLFGDVEPGQLPGILEPPD